MPHPTTDMLTMLCMTSCIVRWSAPTFPTPACCTRPSLERRAGSGGRRIHADPWRPFFCLQDYEFKIQVPAKAATDPPITVGKADLDMARFCSDETETNNHLLPVTVKVLRSTIVSALSFSLDT